MHKTRIVGLDSYLKNVKKDVTDFWVSEQNRRLIDYAMEKIIQIGDRINSYHSSNHMDRTGNLLNSLCWGVSYDGKLVAAGFYRKRVLHNKGIAQDTKSYLHEWFSGDEKYLIPVNGRQLAIQYARSYGNNGSKGWKVFFAILAPYWGYWENGFNMRRKIMSNSDWDEDDVSNTTSRFLRFSVMTEFYDIIKKELKPARVRFRHPITKYDHQKLIKKWNAYA